MQPIVPWLEELGPGPHELPSASAPLAADVARRQITIMFCDLVASTALSAQLDLENLRNLMMAYYARVADAVRRFDGVVAKFVGDGVLAYFGAPYAHEDDAERAVRAGLAAIEAVAALTPTFSKSDPERGFRRLPGGEGRDERQLQVRIGIATGLVVVGDMLGELAIGQAPSLAARLEELAEPGRIVISAATRQLLAGRFRVRELGSRALKGFAEPVTAWEVEGVSAAESRFEAGQPGKLTEFVGRQHELGLLLERWRLARKGQGQVVLLSGEPGIGKSRILRELRERLEQENARSLRFHCSPYHANSAFYPITDNFERGLQFCRGDTAQQKLDKLEALIVGEYGRPLEDLRFLASMLSIPCDDRYGRIAMTPQKFKDEILRALIDTVEAIAWQQPTIMLFEDAHWADPTTLEILDLLTGRVRNFPLLVVITHRPEFAFRWSRHEHIAALGLTKLTREQSVAMVSRLAGRKPLPAELLDQILGKADGVPLFVEELTKSLLESGDLSDAGDRWEYGRPAGGLGIPLTLRDSLMARLDRFGPVKQVAQIGAAIGRAFSYELIAAVATDRKPELDRMLTQLVQSELIFQKDTPPAATYTFKHALVRDAAYDSLLKLRRQKVHLRIARAIEKRFPEICAAEPELLAHHYNEARQPEKAIPLLQKAGLIAPRRLALVESIAHLENGLRLIATLPESAERDGKELDLRTLLGTAWIALKGWPAQEVSGSLRPALTLARSLGRTDALLPILGGICVNVMCAGRVAESLLWVKQILEAAEEHCDPDLAVLGHTRGMTSYFWLGQLIEAREHAEQLLKLYSRERHARLAEVLNHDPKTVALLYTAPLIWMQGYPEHALQVDAAKEAHAAGLGRPFDLAFALTTGSMLFDHLREPDEVLDRVARAELLARQNSLPFVAQMLAPVHFGVAAIRKGNLEEGVASLRGGLAVWERIGGRVGNPYLKSVLAEGLAGLGDLDGALDTIDDIIAQVERPGWEERHYYAETLRIKGWLLALKGELEGAERSYVASLDWARQQQAKSWELRTATSYARLMRDQGRVCEAYDLLAPIHGWFTEGFGTKDLKDAKALLAELGEPARRETDDSTAATATTG